MSIRFPITYCIHSPYKTSSEQQLQQQQTTEKVVRGRHDGGYSTQNSNQIFELCTYKLQRKHTNTQSPANSHVLNKTRLRRHMLIRFPIPTVSTFSSKRSLSNSCSSGKVKSRSIFIQHPSTSHPVAHSMEQFIPPFNQNRLPKE